MTRGRTDPFEADGKNKPCRKVSLSYVGTSFIKIWPSANSAKQFLTRRGRGRKRKCTGSGCPKEKCGQSSKAGWNTKKRVAGLYFWGSPWKFQTNINAVFGAFRGRQFQPYEALIKSLYERLRLSFADSVKLTISSQAVHKTKCARNSNIQALQAVSCC